MISLVACIAAANVPIAQTRAIQIIYDNFWQLLVFTKIIKNNFRKDQLPANINIIMLHNKPAVLGHNFTMYYYFFFNNL